MQTAITRSPSLYQSAIPASAMFVWLLPFRFPLLDEGSEAFLGGFGRPRGRAHRGADGELGFKLLGDSFVEEAFRELQSFGGAGGAFFAELGAAGPEAG